MTAKLDITLKTGQVLAGNSFLDVDPFFVEFPGEDKSDGLAAASNTRRYNTALGIIGGLFTLDSSQDEFEEVEVNGKKERQIKSVGVNYREPLTTRLRVVDPSGAILFIASGDISFVRLYDEGASTPATPQAS